MNETTNEIETSSLDAKLTHLGQKLAKPTGQMTLEELEAQCMERRKLVAEDRNDKYVWPENRDRIQAIVEATQQWARHFLIPLIKSYDEDFSEQHETWESRRNAIGKLYGVYPYGHKGAARLVTRATLGGAQVNLYSFPEGKEETAARLADMFLYHFRHYRKIGKPVEESLNGILKDTQFDYACNPYLVRQFYLLEAMLLAQYCLVPHQHKKVRRLPRQDRSRVAAVEESNRLMKLRNEAIISRFSGLEGDLTDRVAGLELAVKKILHTDFFPMMDRLVKLETGMETIAKMLLDKASE